MKNAVELLSAKLGGPIERSEICSHEVTSVTTKILEIAGTKIIDHRQSRCRVFFLQTQHEIRADEAGTAGDEEIKVF